MNEYVPDIPRDGLHDCGAQEKIMEENHTAYAFMSACGNQFFQFVALGNSTSQIINYENGAF